MRIERLILQDVGVFDKLDVEFPKINREDRAEIHIFTGPNGSGKSTLLYAMAGVLDFENLAREGDLIMGMGTDEAYAVDLATKRFREDEHYAPGIEVFFEGGQSLACYTSSRKKRSRFQPINSPTLLFDYRGFNFSTHSPNSPIKEYCSTAKNYNPLFQEYRNYVFDFAFLAYAGSRSIEMKAISGIVEPSDNPLDDALSFEKSTQSERLLQWIANNKAKAALAAEEGNDDLANEYRRTIATLEDAIARIIDQPIQFVLETNPINVRIKYEGDILDFDVLPDGVISVLSWIADVLVRIDRIKWRNEGSPLEKNIILFLDEVDIHMHPEWQRRILPALQTLFPAAQIFVSTHSPFVVGSVDDAWVYKLGPVNGGYDIIATEEAMAGSSYMLVLDEIFGIDQYFDPQTEHLLKEFHQLKRSVLAGNKKDERRLRELAGTLSDRSIELSDIVQRELRQIVRITGRDVVS